MSAPGWKPTGADPAAPRKEFDPAPRPLPMGDPATDRPGTMRVEDYGRRYDPTATRVILRTEAGFDDEPWVRFSGEPGAPAWFTHDQVRGWPITTELHVGVAFRDRSADGTHVHGRALPLDGSDVEGDRPFR